MLAYAKSLLLTGASGRVDLVLPVPPSDCHLVSDRANVSCEGDTAQVSQPISGTWPTTRQFEVESAAGNQIDLATLSQQEGGGVSFSVTGGGTLRLCMGQAADGSSLALRIGSTEVTLPSSDVPVCSGLVLSFRSAAALPTSGFILQGITGTKTVLHGKQMTFSFDTLRLTLHSTSSDSSYGDGGRIEIDSGRQFTFAASGVPPALAARDQVVSDATKVREAGVERLANAYSHYTWMSYALSALGAAITLLIWRLGR
jgi:hypothetical protein